MFQVKYRRTRFPAWMESSVEERREWRRDSRQPIVPSWRVFRSFQPMPPYRCEFEKLLQSYTYVLPSHMSPVLPQKVFAAARWQFRFYHVNLTLVQTHSIIDCVGISCLCFATAYPRLFCWDSTSQQLINSVVAPAAGILDYLWNGFVDPASDPVREPPPQTIPGVQPDWSNPSGSETPGQPSPGPVDIELFSHPTTNEECADKPIGAPEDED